jgi:soluble lytic murein transglycosylase
LLVSFSLSSTPFLYGQSLAPRPPSAAAMLDPLDAAKKLAAAKFRLNHARELLGKGYSKSVVASGESVEIEDLNKFVAGWIQDKLPPVWRYRAPKIAQTLIDEARKYQFDPIFLVAVIQNESKWNPSAKGDVGELGLMQIRPTTGQWISRRHNLLWRGKISLYNPEINIRVGSAYLAHLRGKFTSRGRLYLAAYNMGGQAVRQALMRKIFPKDYAEHVMHYYVSIYEDLADFVAEAAEKAHPRPAAPAAMLAQAQPQAPSRAAPAVPTGVSAIESTAPEAFASPVQGHAPAAQGPTQAQAPLQLYPATEED